MSVVKIPPLGDAWFKANHQDLLAIGAMEFVKQGRDVIIVESADSFKEGSFDYSYAPAADFIQRNPDGLGVLYGGLLQTYDPNAEAVVALVETDEGPLIAFGLVGLNVSGAS